MHTVTFANIQGSIKGHRWDACHFDLMLTAFICCQANYLEMS